MRIQPDHDTPPALRPSASSATAGDGFASALTSARNSVDPSLPAATDRSNAGKTPLAQRWGHYGQGATAEGYGAPPDAADYSDVPVGPDQPASPLNPGGVSTTPAFVVPGFTARGTPIPPGFYNIAYYNWYLREGGTPLDGFPQLEDGATLTETYGKFGDGAKRATSFVTGLQPEVDSQTANAAATAAMKSADTGGAASVAAAATANSTRTATASSNAASDTSHDETPAAAAAGSVAGGGATVSAPTTDLNAIVRAELTTLLRDLLRVG
jgi:hypothetical protein